LRFHLCEAALPIYASRRRRVFGRDESDLAFDLDRITQDPGMMDGKPCIRGMRVTVGMIVGQLGAGRDPFPHTATAKGVFDSGSIAPGGSWRYTAKIVGEHSYTCTFHPNMKGTLRVE
jgi:hypothetical protein